MRTTLVTAALALSLGVLTSHALSSVALAKEEQVGSQPGSGFTTVLSSAMRYTMNYEQRFALLAADEHYVQELQRPPNPGSNLSRSNPGGGMQGGGADQPADHQVRLPAGAARRRRRRLHAVPRHLRGQGPQAPRARRSAAEAVHHERQGAIREGRRVQQRQRQAQSRQRRAHHQHPAAGDDVPAPARQRALRVHRRRRRDDCRPHAAKGDLQGSGAADADQDVARARPRDDGHHLDRSVQRHGGEDRAERRRSGRAHARSS